MSCSLAPSRPCSLYPWCKLRPPGQLQPLGTGTYSQIPFNINHTEACASRSCEPACGYTSNLSPGATGPVQSCNQNNGPAASGAQNACFASSGNLAFSCDKYQPIIVNSTLSYGFAGHGNTATSTCCKCYQFTWTSGAASGKSMIVQAINAGGMPTASVSVLLPTSRRRCARNHGH